MVHGDDFAFAAAETAALNDIKVRGVFCTGKRDVCEIEILGSSLRWTKEMLEYEASKRHHQALPQGMGLRKESEMVSSPTVMREEMGQEEYEESLEGAEKTRFRSLAATLNYMSLDRSDVQYAAKEMCAKMANPTHGSWKRWKKACGCLRRVERVTWVMGKWDRDGDPYIDVHSTWIRSGQRDLKGNRREEA